MKYSLIVAALVGTQAVQRHHHHHHTYVQTSDDAKAVAAGADAELAGEAGSESPAEAAAEAKEEAKLPTAADVVKEAAAVLKPKAADSSTEAQR
jgi:hypothetical protein